MLSQLVTRFDTKKKKSAIVVISSVASIKPISGATTYCATKTFATYVAEGLNFEVRDKIDVISYTPAGVATKMIH
jgi:short-subunit dehydrogenase